MRLSRRNVLRVGAVLPLAGSALFGADRRGNTGTIQSALDAAVPGDTIELADGIYHGPAVFPRSGTPNEPITLQGAPGAQVIIDGAEPELQTQPAGHWTPMPEIGSGIYRTQVPYGDGDPRFARTSWVSRYETNGTNDADRLIAAYATLAQLQGDQPPRGEGSFRDEDLVYVKLDGGADPNMVGLSVPRVAAAVQLNGQSNVTVQNLEIRNGGWAGITMGGEMGPIGPPVEPAPYEGIVLQDLTIRNCYKGIRGNFLTGAAIRRVRILNGKVPGWPRAGAFVPSLNDQLAPWRGHGIWVGGQTDDLEVVDCLISGQWDGLKVVGTSNGVRIHHCTIRNIWDDGIELESSSPLSNIEFFNNHLYDVNVAVSVGYESPGPIYVYRNVAEGDHDRDGAPHGIKSGEGPAGAIARDVKIYHNTFYSRNTTNVWRKFDTPVEPWFGYDFVNNIFHTGGPESCQGNHNFNFRGAACEDDGGVNHWEANVYNIDDPVEEDRLTLPGLEDDYVDFNTSPRDLRLVESSAAVDSGSDYPGQLAQGWPDSIDTYPGGRNRGAWENGMEITDIGAPPEILNG